MRFTDKQISSLKPEIKQYYKRESEGFAIRVLPSGVKTWLFIYTIGGKRRQMNLGDYPDITLAMAKGRAAEARKAAKDGKDPQDEGFEWHRSPEREKRKAKEKAEEERCNPSVCQLANEYMERHAKKKKRESSWTEDRRLLDRNVLPAWGERKAKDIKKRDAKLLLEAFMDRPALCNNVLKVARKMFNFAVEEEILEFSPFTGVKAPVDLVSRERVLTETEIKSLWNVELPKASMSEETKRILKLILVTAQRPGEVAGIHAREVDGDWWTIPAERAKNKIATRVFLTRTAHELLGESKGHFFPSPVLDKEGYSGNGHIDENAVAYAVRRNLKDYKPRRSIKGTTVSMVKVKEEKKMNMEHFTPHDLRRTTATFLAQLQFPDETIDAVLGHKKTGVVKIYNRHKYDNEKQIALEAWERKLTTIINGSENNVIFIKRKTKMG